MIGTSMIKKYQKLVLSRTIVISLIVPFGDDSLAVSASAHPKIVGNAHIRWRGNGPAYSIARYARIPITPITVSVPLCITLAGGARAFASRLKLLHEVLRYCDMHDLLRLAATSSSTGWWFSILSSCARNCWRSTSSMTLRASMKYYQSVMLSSPSPQHSTYSCLPPTPTVRPPTSTSMFLAARMEK